MNVIQFLRLQFQLYSCKHCRLVEESICLLDFVQIKELIQCWVAAMGVILLSQGRPNFEIECGQIPRSFCTDSEKS